MDASTINAITSAQATISATCAATDGLRLSTAAQVVVASYDDIQAIAEIIYGPHDVDHLHTDRDDNWTSAWLESPEGVLFSYSDYGLRAYEAADSVIEGEVD